MSNRYPSPTIISPSSSSSPPILPPTWKNLAQDRQQYFAMRHGYTSANGEGDIQALYNAMNLDSDGYSKQTPIQVTTAILSRALGILQRQGMNGASYQTDNYKVQITKLLQEFNLGLSDKSGSLRLENFEEFVPPLASRLILSDYNLTLRQFGHENSPLQFYGNERAEPLADNNSFVLGKRFHPIRIINKKPILKIEFESEGLYWILTDDSQHRYENKLNILTTALKSNEDALDLAEKNGELSDVGALYLEGKRIKQEIDRTKLSGPQGMNEKIILNRRVILQAGLNLFGEVLVFMDENNLLDGAIRTISAHADLEQTRTIQAADASKLHADTEADNYNNNTTGGSKQQATPLD